MKKRKEALQGATDFHYENFLRRSRYTTVFLVLVAAFCVIALFIKKSLSAKKEKTDTDSQEDDFDNL